MTKLILAGIAALWVLNVAAAQASASKVNEPSVFRTIWACNGINVEMLVADEESSMGGDNPQNVITFNFENLPTKKFTLKAHSDAEGPLFWRVELNGEACDKTLN
jgi:hypothetical protein